MNLERLESKLGTTFHNKDLLKEALTHRSYLNENPTWNFPSNERLEFLGDAVLELVTTEDLFHQFPRKQEGDLTTYRAALVNAHVLAEVAVEVGLDQQILLSKGESQETSSRGRETIYADGVEAVIGALYLDQGYKAAEQFIRRHVLTRVDEVLRRGAKDPKSLVQEIVQERFKVTPTYAVLEESGPAHDRTFRVGLYCSDELKSEGIGNSKQAAETQAAEKLLLGLIE